MTNMKRQVFLCIYSVAKSTNETQENIFIMLLTKFSLCQPQASTF